MTNKHFLVWLAMRQNGMTFEAIAQQFRVSKSTVEDQIYKFIPGNKIQRDKKAHLELVSEWTQLHKNGMGYKAIAKKYSVHPKTIWRYIHKFFPKQINQVQDRENTIQVESKQISSVFCKYCGAILSPQKRQYFYYCDEICYRNSFKSYKKVK